MYPLNNQSVLNYFQLLFIKTKLEPHSRHSKSSPKSQHSAVISATPAALHMSSWSGGSHTLKIKINLRDTKQFRALVFNKFDVWYSFHRNLYKFRWFVCLGGGLSLGSFAVKFYSSINCHSFLPCNCGHFSEPQGSFCGVWRYSMVLDEDIHLFTQQESKLIL